MAEISAKMVKDLREMTGAGMMDCKKALVETQGNMDEAVEYLRKKGQAKAEKKASRVAAEGICRIAVKDNSAAVVEVNSETDFVAKNEKFQTFVEQVADVIVQGDYADVDALLAAPFTDANTVQEALVEKIATIGEKLSIRRFEKITAENGCVVTYTHGGGRIGVIVEAATDVVNDAVKEALSNVAMQVAALYPKYVSRDEIGQDFIDHEREIILAQIMQDEKQSQKPANVIDGIVNGRVNKELKEICLLDQIYVKAEDGKQTVAQYLAQVAKENSANLSIKRFVRFETGEGLEKKSENFAAEVAAQMNA